MADSRSSTHLPESHQPHQHTIRAKDEATKLLLEAVCAGNIEYILAISKAQPDGRKRFGTAHCTSGCTALHWAAGCNQVHVLRFLLEGPGTCNPDTSTTAAKPIFESPDIPITACRKSYGRTPLHYSCRNGCLEATKYLIEAAHANPHCRAKHDVSIFQLAVWQYRLDICRYLHRECDVDPARDVNEFQCGAVHWLGIAPMGQANYCGSAYHDGRDLLPMAKWLASLEGIDFYQKQKQGHSALHKASWGGHLALVKYLHEEHGMMDDAPDHAGNYAASLADMANTPRHDEIAKYLRRECSTARRTSCAILGVAITASEREIRRAYFRKAKELHPDRHESEIGDNNMTSSSKTCIELISI